MLNSLFATIVVPLFTAVEDTVTLLGFKERGFYWRQVTLINLRSSRRRRENRFTCEPWFLIIFDRGLSSNWPAVRAAWP